LSDLTTSIIMHFSPSFLVLFSTLAISPVLAFSNHAEETLTHLSTVLSAIHDEETALNYQRGMVAGQ
jgi:hypothetical protein